MGAICVLRALVLVASSVAGVSLQMGRTRGGAEFSSYELAYLGGSCLYVLAFLLAVPLFLVWLYRARARQRWFAAARPSARAAREVSPIRAVLVWFIPALNLFLPYMSIEELFADEGQRPSDRPLYLPLWWGTFIASSVIGLFAVVSAGLGRRAEIAGVGLWIQTLSEVLLAISAFLAGRFVAEFERRTALRSLESVF